MEAKLILIPLITGLIASYFANLLFPGKIMEVMRYVRGFRSRRILLKFWGDQNGRWLKCHEELKNKKAYIYYPSYPIPGVGRTEKSLGYYVSAADAKAVELLEQKLSGLGFECERLTTEKIDTKQPIPENDGIVILVCGPKLDTTTNQVVYDPLIGGNPVSSWFYLRYHKAMRMKLSYNHTKGRKEYEVPEVEGVYEQTEGEIDKGILVKMKIEGRLFFLCWGIHDTATLGTLSLALDPESLKRSKLLHASDIMAVVTASKTSNMVVSQTANWHQLNLIIAPPKETKPAPFKLNESLDIETPVYGLSYLWATKDNVSKVKNGNYAQLSPVAAEFDTSLSCPYNCDWCPYKEDRKKGGVLKNKAKALAIVNKLRDSGVKLVVITGGGEPLVSKCVEDVVEHCTCNEMKVILYTNGLLLDDLRAYHLMSRGVSEIRISLDDVSSVDSYMAVHGINSSIRYIHPMETVEKNTRKLLELRARNGFSTLIGASFLVSDKTLPNLKKSAETLSKWLREVGPFDYVIIRPAVNYWPYINEFHNTFFNYRDDDFQMLEKAAQQFKENGVARHIFISRQRFKDLQQKSSETYRKCRASTIWMNIGPDGEAYLCCETKHKPNLSLGNILNVSIDQLQNMALNKISNEVFFNRCPVLLCKPSALNQLFSDIELERKKNRGIMPEKTRKWLDELETHNQNAETLIPSVSGLYEECNYEY